MNMKFFEYDHLPEHLQKVSEPICQLAQRMQLELPVCEEKEIGLRKLLEAKDCFVRASITEAPLVTSIDTLAYMILYKSVETLNGPCEDVHSIRCIITLADNPDIKITFAYQYTRGIVANVEDITRIVAEHDTYIRHKLQEQVNEVRDQPVKQEKQS